MSLLGGPQVQSPPTFEPANIPKLSGQALKFDESAFDLGRAAMEFPGIIGLQDQVVKDAISKVTSGPTPDQQNNSAQTALQNALGAFGGGAARAPSIGGAGSAAKGGAAADIATQNSAIEDYNQAYAENVYAENLPTQWGLSGQNAVQIAIANALGKAQNKYQINAANQQQSNLTNAYIQQQIATAVSIALAASDRRLKKDIVYVGVSPNGLKIAEFKYLSDAANDRKYRGVISQDLLDVVPEAVLKVGDYLFVNYGHPRVDVELEAVT